MGYFCWVIADGKNKVEESRRRLYIFSPGLLGKMKGQANFESS